MSELDLKARRQMCNLDGVGEVPWQAGVSSGGAVTVVLGIGRTNDEKRVLGHTVDAYSSALKQ